MTTQTFTRRASLLVLALALGALPAAAQTRVKSGFNLFTPEQDVEIGRQSAAEAERQLSILRDRAVEAYVSSIGERLASKVPGPRFDYVFRVVDSPDLNAFALPGGFIYLNRGVLEAARNEGEVAGVLAHEIAHVALRHGTHAASKAYLASAGLGVLGGLLGRRSESTGEIVEQVGGFGLNVLFLKYSREAESQADVIGAQVLSQSGYNPEDMISFFQLLEGADRRRTAQWLSSHPTPTRRVERIREEAQVMGVPLHASTMTSELRDVQSRLRGAPVARAGTRSPATRTPSTRTRLPRVEPPSRTLQRYESETGMYRVDFPSNWRVHEEGTYAVTLAPEGGVLQSGGRTEVVYGAMLNHYEPFRTRGDRSSFGTTRTDELTEATEDLAATLVDVSPYLRMQQGSVRRFRGTDVPTMSFALAGRNPRTGLRERVVVVTKLLSDDHLVYLLFVTPEEEADAYFDVLDDMADSLRIRDHLH